MKPIRRIYLEQKVRELDEAIDQALERNDFLLSQQLEGQLRHFEGQLLSCYTPDELFNLTKEAMPQ